LKRATNFTVFAKFYRALRNIGHKFDGLCQILRSLNTVYQIKIR